VKTSDHFNKDPYPNRPKILFIGSSISTHTHAWIDLLKEAPFNVRLFSLPMFRLPPSDWKVHTYLPVIRYGSLNRRNRKTLLSFPEALHSFLPARFAIAGLRRVAEEFDFEERWLARIIRTWKPDIIHTLGLNPAGFFFYHTSQRFHLDYVSKWIVQLRGGSDLTLSHLDTVKSKQISACLNQCNQIISDNLENVRLIESLGISAAKLAPIVPVPGTGGVDVDALQDQALKPVSKRREILWPKAFVSKWSKGLPVLEGIKIAWDRIQPCSIQMLAVDEEIASWIKALPVEIQQCCQLHPRIPRSQALEKMARARVLLAPSLVDGVPNSLYEAMASSAYPIVSPLSTMTGFLENEENVLFARNLYPDEIAAALVRAMNDDVLIEKAAENNLHLVRRIADRKKIIPRVAEYYQSLANASPNDT
jgi:glycosyltransferase involved in cell wall biosynthesis